MAHSDSFHPNLRAEALFILVGDLFQLAVRVLRLTFSRSLEVVETINQIRLLGIKSLSIVNLTAIFAGMVMALQFGTSMARFGAREYVGQVVAMSIVRELGPVLTALMVGGRIGAGITAELGSMRVTEQIDAIRVLGADPLSKLVVPRVLAATLIMPLLTAIADVVGIIGGAIISNLEFGLSPMFYYQSVVELLKVEDFTSGIAKGLVFGFFIGLIACRQGFRTSGGTEGVGQATTQTVVITSVNTLITDLVLTKLLLLL